MSSSNFQEGILLATKDGGRNWTELPPPPTVDQMTWISPNVGWIAGGVLKGDLFSTRNGGLTWQKQPPPVPNATNQFGQAAPPRFSNSQHGMFVVTFATLKVDDHRSLVAVYRTSDSGKTWLRSVLREIPSLSVSAGVADDGSPIWAHLDKGKVSTAGPSSSNSAPDPSMSVRAGLGVMGLSFIDADTGFLLVHGNDCSVVKPFCPDIWRLFFTKDAGKTVLDVTPSQKSSSPRRSKSVLSTK